MGCCGGKKNAQHSAKKAPTGKTSSSIQQQMLKAQERSRESNHQIVQAQMVKLYNQNKVYR